MTNLNCLTEENFKLVINYIKSNGSDNTYPFNDWILEYRNDNRIAFSKSTSDKYRTLGSVINEKDSVKVYSTIILKIKHDEVKEEIKKKFCEFVQKIKNYAILKKHIT